MLCCVISHSQIFIKIKLHFAIIDQTREIFPMNVHFN